MATERPFVENLELAGFKSIRRASIDFTKLNVLIGPNGAGKSNLVSFFALLGESLNGNLDEHVKRNGESNAFLHGGAKHTNEITAALTVHTAEGRGVLHHRLGFRALDRLGHIVNHAASPGVDRSGEIVFEGHCSVTKLSGTGHPGTLIHDSLKNRLATYHFSSFQNKSIDSEGNTIDNEQRSRLSPDNPSVHLSSNCETVVKNLFDTNLISMIRTERYIQDNHRLHPGGANLASMLYRYKLKDPLIYQRIRSTVRKIAPSFDDFVLEPQRFNPDTILLKWRQRESDYLFGPHQLSDGTLRAMALCTLLLQPAADLPDLLILDEPELGLHPLALTIVSGLIRAASVHVQIIVTTQSTAFLDQFGVDEIIVVDSAEGESQFRRLDPNNLKDWLEEYSVGELWSKNVIGGGPMS